MVLITMGRSHFLVSSADMHGDLKQLRRLHERGFPSKAVDEGPFALKGGLDEMVHSLARSEMDRSPLAEPLLSVAKSLFSSEGKAHPFFRAGRQCGAASVHELIAASSIRRGGRSPPGPLEGSPLELTALAVAACRSVGMEANLAYWSRPLLDPRTDGQVLALTPLAYLPMEDKALESGRMTLFHSAMKQLQVIEVLDDDASSFVMRSSFARLLLEQSISLLAEEGPGGRQMAVSAARSMGHLLHSAWATWPVPGYDEAKSSASEAVGTSAGALTSIRTLMEARDFSLLLDPISQAIHASRSLLTAQMQLELGSLLASEGPDGIHALISRRSDEDASVRDLALFLDLVPPTIRGHMHDERSCPCKVDLD